MRVVHVHRIAGIGGSERHLLTLLPALTSVGVEPLMLGLDDPSAEPEPFHGALRAARVESVSLPCPRDVDPLLARGVVRAVRELRPDLVHTHLVHADVYGGVAAVRTRTRLVSTKHNDDPFRLGVFRHVECALARRARAVVAISDSLARFNVERVGLPREKVTVIPYGLDDLASDSGGGDAGAVAVAHDADVLLAIGRLVPQKGHDVAVAALPAIRAQHPQVILVVLGDGPLRARLEAQAAALGVADAVVLPGRASEIRPWLQRAAMLVHPARWEGFGLVVLEAMLAGRPVVASRASALPELVVDRETGLLVPVDDPAALAAAVSRLLDDRTLAERLGAGGRARARSEFSVARMAGRTHALYARVLAG